MTEQQETAVQPIEAQPAPSSPPATLRDLGLKVVLTWKGDKASIGISAEGCDPVFRIVPHGIEGGTPEQERFSLETVLLLVSDLISEAQAQWAQAKQNPAYKRPVPPQVTRPARAQAPAAAARPAGPTQTAML